MRMAKLLLAMIVAAVIYPVTPAAAADPAVDQGPTIVGVEKAVDFTLSTPDAKAAGRLPSPTPPTSSTSPAPRTSRCTSASSRWPPRTS